MRGLLALALIAGPTAAMAGLETTHICGRVVQADPGLLNAAGEFFGLGDFFKATMITDDSSATPTACGSSCGTIRALAADTVVLGGLDSISAPDATNWSTTGSIDSFNFGGSNGPEAAGTILATLVGARATGDIHPNYPSGELDGTAEVAIELVLSESPYLTGTFTLTAMVETVGTACSDYIPTLPMWGFPLLGVGMLASAAVMLRKRA